MLLLARQVKQIYFHIFGPSFEVNKAPYLKEQAQLQQEKASQWAPVKIAWDKTACQNSCGTSRMAPFFMKPHWLVTMFSHRTRIKKLLLDWTIPMPSSSTSYTFISVTHCHVLLSNNQLQNHTSLNITSIFHLRCYLHLLNLSKMIK